jgi:tetratricopeptide (TPR) repeat protein
MLLGNWKTIKPLRTLVLLVFIFVMLSTTGIVKEALFSIHGNFVMKQVTTRMVSKISFDEDVSEGPDSWALNLTDKLRLIRSEQDPTINKIVIDGSNGQIGMDTLCRVDSWFNIMESYGRQEFVTCQGGVTADAYKGAWLWAQGDQDKAILYWQQTNIATLMLEWARQLIWTNRTIAFEWAELAGKVDTNGSACFTLQWFYGIDGQWANSLEAYQCLLDHGRADGYSQKLAAGAILYGSGDLRRAIQTFDITSLRLADQVVIPLYNKIENSVPLYETDKKKSSQDQVLNGNAWAMTVYWMDVMGWNSSISQLAALYLLMGNAFEMVGDFPRAIEWYQRLVQITPTDCHSHNFLGHAYSLSGEILKASEERSFLQ